MIELDKVDRTILSIIQMNGRLTNAEIAARVSLSPPASWKRLKRLEEEVIDGYYATLNRKALGLNVFAFISITLDSHSEEAMDNFERGVDALPNVLACHNISGKYDYLLQVVVEDMDEFHKLAMFKIRRLGNIKEMYTGFSLREVKRSTTLPL
ncbi:MULTISPECIES: Lrp/AsnC family transcriptional regulator [Pseudomonas]|jgi:Lrp/AsnC family leucine-responsive transcriptional regulator|uniref:Lrp/AsnC family transcriptional regulator n=1 Tax=Pseudomonas sp. WC2401 TaxID=3234143 RepID=A0AB39WVH5_9PSED|nr:MULTISPECIES: Lrp/AsnC family transcriptional regulator [Pseudomonas]MDY7580738.1 Lrp/AsnC family transcriptional regulator [Pseudomonas sp. CCI3.1]MEB0067208.1 Lrp/AsnC family transcriptional regulator [Pseudomonas sp. CCI3.1]MEB0074009.1 Lrp/AsnC family transcriptional regulator [Pseudomonas sp. CCI1.4]NMY55375.1 Lrp/AsnC family transcriptional regulator [Pseudomonas sp. WS 5051]WRT58698.1 Lrp/AsnC family transcriptional regulator [Pseudomonas fragi]